MGFVESSPMASGLCWMPVTVALLLSAGNSLAAVSQNQLGAIVTEILQKYRPSYEADGGSRRSPMFSLAVSIPYNSDRQMFDISKVTDTGDQVIKEILKCNVYTGTRVVAATVLRWPNVVSQCPDERVQWPHVLRRCPGGVLTWADVHRRCPNAVRDGAADHAEYRALQHFNSLLDNRNRKDLLLFYVLASPCDKRCTSGTNPRSILKSINQILNWNTYAVVFSDVFRPRSGAVIPEEDLRKALEWLGKHRGLLGSIGLNNIFRCNRESADSRKVKCTSCLTGDQVTRHCFSDEPGFSHNSPSTSLIQQGRSDSSLRKQSKNRRFLK